MSVTPVPHDQPFTHHQLIVLSRRATFGLMSGICGLLFGCAFLVEGFILPPLPLIIFLAVTIHAILALLTLSVAILAGRSVLSAFKSSTFSRQKVCARLGIIQNQMILCIYAFMEEAVLLCGFMVNVFAYMHCIIEFRIILAAMGIILPLLLFLYALILPLFRGQTYCGC